MVIAMNKMTLTHLSNITAYDDISCPSKAIKRGMHCPLFGCILLTKYIADMPFLIVGTDECGFYGREIIKVVADDPLSYVIAISFYNYQPNWWSPVSKEQNRHMEERI